MSETPANHEAERLFALQATRLLNTPASEGFDRITRLAADLFDMPTALVSLVSAKKQWFKSRFGMPLIETDRALAFCALTIQQPSVMVVEDATLDERFRANAMVTGDPGIRFYAGAPLRTAAGHALGSLCVIDYKPRTFTPAQCRQLADMAKLVMAQIDLMQLAGHVNDITRLPNRAQWVDDLEDLKLAGDTECRTLVLVDVMSQSRLQPALLAVGIPALETALRLVAARLHEILNDRSPLYHVRETRFAFVLQSADTTGDTATIGKILTELGRPMQAGGVDVELDVACGAVTFESTVADASDVLIKAASAMYEAQRRQLPFLWYHSSFGAVHLRLFALMRALPIAMTDGELRLVYQPKLDVVLGCFTAVEALIRWHHPRWGEVQPGEFIPTLENTATIHLLTEWVLHTALAHTAIWQAQGLFVSMAVNVSARNLEHPQFIRVVRNACAVHGVEPRHLHLECTENAVLTGERSLGALIALCNMGVQISLDDFGIGYSNLACLQKLPVGLLKIDQSLVQPIPDDDRAWKVLQSLIFLGHTLGYRVLAEGVQTEEIYRLLAKSGCDGMQGYFLSKPIEAEEILVFMRDQQQTLARLAKVMPL